MLVMIRDDFLVFSNRNFLRIQSNATRNSLICRNSQSKHLEIISMNKSITCFKATDWCAIVDGNWRNREKTIRWAHRKKTEQWWVSCYKIAEKPLRKLTVGSAYAITIITNDIYRPRWRLFAAKMTKWADYWQNMPRRLWVYLYRKTWKYVKLPISSFKF